MHRAINVILVCCLLVVGCKDSWINPATVTTHTPPILGLVVTASKDSPGSVDQSGLTSDAGPQASANVSPNTTLLFGASATSNSGVKRLQVILPNGATVEQMGTPRASDGYLPNQVLIVGSNGSGGSGPSALSYTTTCESQVVKVIGENFQGDLATFDVTFNINAPQQTASLSSDKSSINLGDSYTLTWTSTHATSVSVDGVGPNAPLSGTKLLTPNRTETLGMTAKAPCRADVFASITVQLNNSTPPPPVATTSLAGVFKFTAVAGAPGTQTAFVGITGSTTASGTAGQTTISNYSSPPITYILNGATQQIPFNVPNLRPGVWNVTAFGYNAPGSKITGPISCSVTLPRVGLVMDLTSPNGPQCL